MKKLKIINSFLCAFLLAIILLILNKSNPSYNGMAFGNKYEMSYEGFPKCDKTFLYDNASSIMLLNMVENDVSKIKNNKVVSLSKLIQKSDYFILQIGESDILKNVQYNRYKDELIYDEEIINRKIDMTISSINSIIDSIYSINDDIQLYVLPLEYNLDVKNDFIDNCFINANNRIEKICDIKKCYFLSINNN